ncbi:MAG: capsule assembly Wzi family protein [Pseudomonadota bacterium]
MRSKQFKKILLIFLLIFLVACPVSVWAWDRSTVNVPPDSSLYRDLDKLVAWGLVHPPILGQRPYPRSEFARMTAEARQKLESEEKNIGDRRLKQINLVLNRLEQEFKEDLTKDGDVFRFHPFEELNIYTTYLNSPATTIPPNNGRGLINAQINPMGDYNLGRQAIDGFQMAYEPVAYFQTTKFFSGYARPRLEADMPRQNNMQGHIYLQNGYGVFRAGNFIFEFGRDSMLWGIGERGGLLYSTNPRPLDGIRITNPTPYKLPWVFKYLGYWRYTMFAANFGPEFAQKYAWMAGYKLSWEPVKYVEIGLGHVVMIGGEGAATPSAIDVVGEFFGFRPAGTNSTSPNLTNHIFEVEYLFRIQPLRGLQLYGDISIDDKWKSIKKTLKHGCSYLWGVYLPALNYSGSADLRVEYVKTSPLQYHHGLYSDGFTLNRKLLGTDAGPDADAVYAKFRHTLSDKLWYGLEFGWDYRRSDTYTELVNPNGTAGDVIKVASGPTEQRFRFLADLNWQVKKHLNLHFTTGYERAQNLNFVQNVGRNNYLLALAISLDLDRYFTFETN